MFVTTLNSMAHQRTKYPDLLEHEARREARELGARMLVTTLSSVSQERIKDPDQRDQQAREEGARACGSHEEASGGGPVR